MKKKIELRCNQIEFDINYIAELLRQLGGQSIFQLTNSQEAYLPEQS